MARPDQDHDEESNSASHGAGHDTDRARAAAGPRTPRKKRRRSVLVQFWVTPAQKADWERAAENAGVGLSMWIRRGLADGREVDLSMGDLQELRRRLNSLERFLQEFEDHFDPPADEHLPAEVRFMGGKVRALIGRIYKRRRQ